MKIAKTASLPLEVIKGDKKSRLALARKLSEEIFYKIVEKPNDLSIARIKQITQDTLTKTAKDGRKINIEITDLKNAGECRGIESYITKRNIVEGFKINIPIENDAIIPQYFATFMHELSHVLYQLTNPRLIALEGSAGITKQQYIRAGKFYENTIYSLEPFEWFNPTSAKIKQLIALRGLKTEDKIKVLQDCRHSLKSEFVAYVEEEKFYCRATKYGIEGDFTHNYDKIMFFEKLEYLENEIARLIKKARKEYSASKKEQLV